MEQRRKWSINSHRINNKFANEKVRKLVSGRKNILLPTLSIEYCNRYNLRSIPKINRELQTSRCDKQNFIIKKKDESCWEQKKQNSFNLLTGYAKRQKRMRISEKKLARLFSRYDTMPNHSQQFDKSIDEISQTLRHKIDVIYF